MRYGPLIVAAATILATSSFAQTVTSGTGAAATTARDTFRTDLGGGLVAGPNGSFGGVRREINWDGVPDSFADPNLLPANFFNVNSPRGVTFSTPGTGFLVSSNAGTLAPIQFGGLNPTYPTVFEPFSPQRLFTAVGSNIVDVNFFIPGTNIAALTSGFGVMFSDVDLASTTSITLFDAGNVSLGTFFAPNVFGQNETFSFLGISFDDPRIARVRITSGSGALGANESPTFDLVTMDDFLFGETALRTSGSIPEPSAWVLLIAGFGLAGAALRRRRTQQLASAG
jgi:hypothetical protein